MEVKPEYVTYVTENEPDVDWHRLTRAKYREWWHDIDSWISGSLTKSLFSSGTFIRLLRHITANNTTVYFPSDNQGIIPARNVWLHLRKHIDAFYDLYTDEAIEQHNWNTLVERTKTYRTAPYSPAFKTGFVYLAQAEQLYKIGFSKNPTDRVRQVRSPKGKIPTLIHTIATEDMDGLESALHERYNDKCVQGEWFDLGPADVEYIKGL